MCTKAPGESGAVSNGVARVSCAGGTGGAEGVGSVCTKPAICTSLSSSCDDTEEVLVATFLISFGTYCRGQKG